MPAVTRNPNPWWAVAVTTFAYAGPLKATPLLTWATVDATAVCAAVCLLGVTHHAITNRSWVFNRCQPATMWLWAAFLPGLTLASNTGKATTLLTVTLLCVISGTVLLDGDRARRILAAATVGAAAVVAAATWLLPDPELLEIGRRSVTGANVIGVGRIVGAGVVVAAAYAVASAGWRRYVWGVGATAALAALLATGVRGAVLAAAAAFAAAALTAKSAGGRLRAVTVLAAASAAAGWWLTRPDNATATRVAPLIAGDVDDDARRRLLGLAVEVAAQHPLGVGWGGFARYAAQIGVRGDLRYPHNVSVEIAVEGGWLAAAAWTVFVAVALVGLWRGARSPAGVAMFGLGVYWLTAAHTSSDVNGTRMMWITLGIGLAARSRHAQTRPITPRPKPVGPPVGR